jgi:serine protease
MNVRESVAFVATLVFLFSGLSPTASANSVKTVEKISGVLVQYADGVRPIAPNGEPTGANLLRGEVVSEDLGGGLFVLNFTEPMKTELVKIWIQRMVMDRRIVWAEPNLATQQLSFPGTFKKPSILTKARQATGPRSLVARVAVSSSASDKARVRLSWKPPSSRYGAKIVGYQIQYSSNNGSSYRTLISDTGNSNTRVFVSDGIRAGESYRFRVRAITNDGSLSSTLGAVSNVASALVRTSPKPVYLNSPQMVGPGNVTYIAQSSSDRGGFAASQIRYRAIATGTDNQSFETSLCNETRCRFPDLLPDMTYTVEVFASNAIGMSSSSDAVEVNDFYFPLQWYLTGENGISMPTAWRYSMGDGNKVVAVIDTGIKAHEQIDKSLTRNLDGTVYGYDFVSDLASAGDGDGEDSNPNDEGSDASAGNGYHGTHVAGIIAAEHDFLGTAGVAPNIKLLPVRALGKTGGTIADLVKAVNWSAGEKIDGVAQNRFPVSVINLSLGAKDPISCDGAYSTIFESAIAKGITVVAAAGNESRDSLSFPGNCPGVITVVATQSLGDRATYSNFGTGALVSAPGGEFNVGSTESPDSRGGIISSWVDPSNLPAYRLSEGTSMAAPVVSGIIALMYSMQPSITPAKVRSILQNSVKPFAAGSNCAVLGGCGSGIVNAHLALARTSALK